MLRQKSKIARWLWFAGALAAIWAWPMLQAAFEPAGSRTAFQAGLIQSVTMLDHSMALAGLGLAMGMMPRARGVALILLFAAIGAALWGTQHIVAAFESAREFWRLIDLIGPSGLVLAGLALLLPQRARTGVVPLIAVLIGGGLGVSIHLSRPAGDPLRGFAYASVHCSVFIVMFVALAVTMLRPKDAPVQPWIVIGARIAGSWLIAVGLLLAGLRLLPPQMPEVPAVPIAPPPEFNQSTQP